MTNKPKTRNLTEAEVVAWKSLRRIWDEKKGALGLTQERAAHLMGYETQGAVGHFLNGRSAVTPLVAIKFARILGVSPHEISPEVKSLASDLLSPSTIEGDPAAEQIAEMFRMASAEAKRAVVYVLYSDLTVDKHGLPRGLAPLERITPPKQLPHEVDQKDN